MKSFPKRFTFWLLGKFSIIYSLPTLLITKKVLLCFTLRVVELCFNINKTYSVENSLYPYVVWIEVKFLAGLVTQCDRMLKLNTKTMTSRMNLSTNFEL